MDTAIHLKNIRYSSVIAESNTLKGPLCAYMNVAHVITKYTKVVPEHDIVHHTLLSRYLFKKGSEISAMTVQLLQKNWNNLTADMLPYQDISISRHLNNNTQCPGLPHVANT